MVYPQHSSGPRGGGAFVCQMLHDHLADVCLSECNVTEAADNANSGNVRLFLVRGPNDLCDKGEKQRGEEGKKRKSEDEFVVNLPTDIKAETRHGKTRVN